jgi:hypothetical protein
MHTIVTRSIEQHSGSEIQTYRGANLFFCGRALDIVDRVSKSSYGRCVSTSPSAGSEVTSWGDVRRVKASSKREEMMSEREFQVAMCDVEIDVV